MRINLTIEQILELERSFLSSVNAPEWEQTPSAGDSELTHVSFLGNVFIQRTKQPCTHKNNHGVAVKYRPPLAGEDYSLNPFTALKIIHQWFCDEALEVEVEHGRATVYITYPEVDRTNRNLHDRLCWGNDTYSRESEISPTNKFLSVALGGVVYGVNSGLLNKYLVDDFAKQETE